MQKKSPLRTFSLGLQHVLAMYAGAVIVPLIVGDALGLEGDKLAYLVSVDLLFCGVATLLQVWKNKLFGIGLPVVLGCTFTAVGPMIAIGKQHGISAVCGAVIASGIFVLLFARYFSKLVNLFPPVVTGSVVTIIGITLIPVAVNNMAGGVGSPDFGRPVNLLLAFGVLAFIIILNRFCTGFVRAVSVLLGLIAGTVAAYLLGSVEFASVEKSPWFHTVRPFALGTPTFEWSAVLTMILVAVVSIVESTGVFFALSKICERKLEASDLARGYRAEGLAILLGGLFNAFPYTTYSQNVGLVQLTGVKTRGGIVMAGAILVAFGLVPKIGALTTLIPTPVLGGAMLAMFGMVVASGIKILSQVDFTRQENLIIIACSIGLGLGVTVAPDFFQQLPQQVRILTDNGIVAGSLTAILLHLVFRRKKEPRSASGQAEVAARMEA